MENSKLIFIYNANSGSVNSVMDSLRKLLSPKSYDCKLCELTFGHFSEKSRWKKFRKSSNLEMIFLHKDEFSKQYRSKWLPKYSFPVILSEANNELHIFMGAEELEQIENTSALISEVEKRLKS